MHCKARDPPGLLIRSLATIVEAVLDVSFLSASTIDGRARSVTFSVLQVAVCMPFTIFMCVVLPACMNMGLRLRGQQGLSAVRLQCAYSRRTFQPLPVLQDARRIQQHCRVWFKVRTRARCLMPVALLTSISWLSSTSARHALKLLGFAIAHQSQCAGSSTLSFHATIRHHKHSIFCAMHRRLAGRSWAYLSLASEDECRRFLCLCSSSSSACSETCSRPKSTPQ